MKLKLPFNYDLHISKRGMSMVKDGQLIDFADWLGENTFTNYNTPIIEECYQTIASEFAKIDLMHIVERDVKGKHEYRVLNDSLAYLLSERPNPLQTKYDFLFTMIYQLYKYGNALAFLERDGKGNVTKIVPVNVYDYAFGCGYQIDDDTILLKYQDKTNNKVLLVDYRNIIHMRLNPNNIFSGELFTGSNYTRGLVDLVDSGLSSIISELKDNGTIRGVIQVGENGIGYSNGFANRTMLGKEEKIKKQKEIIERIKSTKAGILVLDAGETWKDLSSPFSNVSTKELDKYIDLLLQFCGISRAVVDGTATSEQMDVFFSKTIMPLLEQFISELNYKVFSKTARSQGHKVEYYRNPFEYVSVTQAIDIAYKGAQDTTTNERRRMIYKLPPIEGGDVLMMNKNFEPIDSLLDYYKQEGEEDGKKESDL